MSKPDLQAAIDSWQLPEGKSLLERVERMVRPALLDGYFGSSCELFLLGSQYHLGGEQDTTELTELASITSSDHVLDVCCFVGGPAIQLAGSYQCKVTGIDISESCIVAARRIAELAGLSHLLDFRVADARDLPYEDEVFTVIWSQCSLQHNESWLEEFDRILAPGGRFAFTFQLRGTNSSEADPFSTWTLEDVATLVKSLGYTVEHADDITVRDIEIGWKALDRKLSTHEQEYVALLGEEWVRSAHNEFANEIQEMQEGKWGNGRIVAAKPDDA